MNNTSQNLSIFLRVSLKVKRADYKVISTKKRLTNTVLNVDNKKKAESTIVKYVGVTDSKLNFDEAVKEIHQRMT